MNLLVLEQFLEHCLQILSPYCCQLNKILILVNILQLIDLEISPKYHYYKQYSKKQIIKLSCKMLPLYCFHNFYYLYI